MNISSRCEYACRAVIELAQQLPNQITLTAQQIAEAQQIPEKYLVHILLQLKRAGLVRSIRGAQGGYALAKQPEDISLLDVVVTIDGPLLEPLPVNDGASPALITMWQRVATAISAELTQISIRDIIDSEEKPNMYYI